MYGCICNILNEVVDLATDSLEVIMALSLREKFDRLRPTMPTVYGVMHESEDVLCCTPKDMKFHADCFVETANVNMIGRWKNVSKDEYMHCVFMIPMRGSITDCFINMGSDRLRAVGLTEKVMMNQGQYDMEREPTATTTINNDDESQYEDNPWSNPEPDDDIKIQTKSKAVSEWYMKKQLFENQIPGYFRIAFDRIKPKQVFRVDLYYIETLMFQKSAFYLRLPTKFDYATIRKERRKWDEVLEISANVHYPKNANLTVKFLHTFHTSFCTYILYTVKFY